jgi:hypothetical protein
MNERERNVVDFLPQRTYRLAGLLTEACQLGGVADAYGAPVFRRLGSGLILSATMFADCLPSSINSMIANQIRLLGPHDKETSEDLAVCRLLRHLDPQGTEARERITRNR